MVILADTVTNPDCNTIATWYAFLGVACALCFTSIGSGYGTAKSAIGVFGVCATKPDFIYRGLMPIIMAGIVGIYGLVAAVIIVPNVKNPYNLFAGYTNLAGGFSVGLTGLASGMCIGIAGDGAARAMGEQPRLIMGAMLILIFGEVLGLYGFIVSIILSGKNADCTVQ